MYYDIRNMYYDLYQKEALRQLSDTSFYAKVDKDLTSTNQQIVREHY